VQGGLPADHHDRFARADATACGDDAAEGELVEEVAVVGDQVDGGDAYSSGGILQQASQPPGGDGLGMTSAAGGRLT
jgi:hypothetical protein